MFASYCWSQVSTISSPSPSPFSVPRVSLFDPPFLIFVPNNLVSGGSREWTFYSPTMRRGIVPTHFLNFPTWPQTSRPRPDARPNSFALLSFLFPLVLPPGALERNFATPSLHTNSPAAFSPHLSLDYSAIFPF